MNEPNGVHGFLVARIAKLEEELEECQIRLIEAKNPGIDIEDIKRIRDRIRESLKNVDD